MANLRRYLLYFAQDHVEFRYPEIKSLIKLFNINLKVPSVSEIPFWIVEDVTENDVRKIASRSLSLRFVVEVWSSGKTYESFHENLKKFCQTADKKFTSADSSFRVTIETYNKHFKQHEKIQKIESMDYLPMKGRIDLKNPDNNFIYFEFWGIDSQNVPEKPEEIVFGRLIAEGQREMVKTISLKTRKFIGNTSMDPLLSLMMANQGLCDKNQVGNV
jgi:tRNA (guanine10-N2)-methyltransferase